MYNVVLVKQTDSENVNLRFTDLINQDTTASLNQQSTITLKKII